MSLVPLGILPSMLYGSRRRPQMATGPSKSFASTLERCAW